MTRVHFQKYVEPPFYLLFVLALFWMSSEVDWLENTIGGLQLFLYVFVGGNLLGLVCGALFGYYHRDLLSGMIGPVLRTMIFAGTTAMTVGAMSIAGASYLNRTHVEEARQLTVTITDKFYGRRQAATPRLVARLPSGDEEHIVVDRPFWDRVMRGDEVALQVCRGVLGYDVVTKWSAVAGDSRRPIGNLSN
ncbi:hypothetical protein [Massilia sp. BSC265]|uniref:hypothetical protein n=1 Tax=Massilia sp. BSC265 TaxID=1549812 RepID=UPI0004E9010D|nr:hypothetical protein [Massilia sp. BSC265]KFI05450.1 hypothetical protein JN27_23770 [Massilia sp. BSC265]